MTMPTNTTSLRSTKSFGYAGKSESVLMPAKRAPSSDDDFDGEEEAGLDVEEMAGPREEATPLPSPPRCEAAVSSLTSASRLLVGLSPPAGVAAAKYLRRGWAGRKGREREGRDLVVAVGLALVCLRIESLI